MFLLYIAVVVISLTSNKKKQKSSIEFAHCWCDFCFTLRLPLTVGITGARAGDVLCPGRIKAPWVFASLVRFRSLAMSSMLRIG